MNWKQFENNIDRLVDAAEHKGEKVTRLEITNDTMKDWAKTFGFVKPSDGKMGTWEGIPIAINDKLAYGAVAVIHNKEHVSTATTQMHTENPYINCKQCDGKQCTTCYRDLYKHHPSKFIEDIFGVELLDYQKWLVDDYYG